MTHLLRSDFYKLRKAKYFRVCLIITILLAVGTVFLLDFTYRIAGDQMASQMASQQDALSESGVSVSVEGIAGSYEDLGAAGQLLTFFAGNTTLILAVLVSLFVGSEFNHGTMKLIASRQYSRLTIYSSKLIAAMAAGIFLTLIYVLFSFLTASFVWGIGDAPSQGWARTIGAAGLELFLLCAFLSLFVTGICVSVCHTRRNAGKKADRKGNCHFQLSAGHQYERPSGRPSQRHRFTGSDRRHLLFRSLLPHRSSQFPEAGHQRVLPCHLQKPEFTSLIIQYPFPAEL